MLRINEAPEIVLAIFEENEKSRNKGYFWSLFCCVPTLGVTVGCLDSEHNLPWKGCCYPAPVSLESDISCDQLLSTLSQIKLSNLQLQAIETKSAEEKAKIITWQVDETLRLVNQAIQDGVIEGSYLDALKEIRYTLNKKAGRLNSHNESTPLLISSEIEPPTVFRM